MNDGVETDAAQRRAAELRLSLLHAVAAAIERRDEVYRIVDEAADADDARTQLMRALGFDEVQATAVLDLQLRRLTRFERDRILREREDFRRMLGHG